MKNILGIIGWVLFIVFGTILFRLLYPDIAQNHPLLSFLGVFLVATALLALYCEIIKEKWDD